MLVLSTKGWKDYELIDSGNGEKLERFGKYTFRRPDPQIIWKKLKSNDVWNDVDAIWQRESEDKGKWIIKKSLPKEWLLSYKDIKFYCKLSPFKHTGLFPEQSLQWDWLEEKIQGYSKPLKVLNLFGYTGIASLVAAQNNAQVTHVDASYPTIGWARDNQKASALDDKQIRWMLDDAIKFCQREVKRGIKYDGIIMDPPSFGHGPKGEKWQFNQSFPQLLDICSKLLSQSPAFILINAYAISISAITLENTLKGYMEKYNGRLESGEIAIQEKDSDRLLSTGIFTRWSNN